MTTYSKTFLALLLLVIVADQHFMLRALSPSLNQAILVFKCVLLLFVIRGIDNE